MLLFDINYALYHPMNDVSEKFIVSWDQIHRDTKELARKLHGRGEWKGIVAVTRGGLIPACIVARELNIRMIETFCIASYAHYKEQQDDARIYKGISESVGDGEGWLVIDDLVDTGNTYKIIRDHLPKAHFACVYAKPQGIPTTDTYVVQVDPWVYFPWDMENQYIKPLVGDD
jgi:xanthine phosphoribosyltransferase